jgi:hypothetical protein
MLGTVGEQERMDGTVISDAVNIASRLEALTKEFGSGLLISQETRHALHHPEAYEYRALGATDVTGRREKVTMFEVLDACPADVRTRKLSTRAAFEEGIQLYGEQRFAEASVRFDGVLRAYPDDATARVYLERSARMIVSHAASLDPLPKSR